MAKSKSQSGKADIIVGLQYGGEGKNKIVDYLSGKYDLLALSCCTPNHPHDNGTKNTQCLPTCAYNFKGTIVIGNNAIVSPVSLKSDMEAISADNSSIMLVISAKAPLYIPTNKMVEDAYRKSEMHKLPKCENNGAYSVIIDSVEGVGCKASDAFDTNFPVIYNTLMNKHMFEISAIDKKFKPESNMGAINDKTAEYIQAIDWLKTQQVGDIEYVINQVLSNGGKMLVVCPDGAMQDPVYCEKCKYSYPTRTTADAAMSCLGIAAKHVKKIIGVFKGYATIYTDAPYIGEIAGKDLRILQATGNEYIGEQGCRCGWIDLIQLKYACMINGVTELAITKIDVLCNLDTIKVVAGYKDKEGRITTEMTGEYYENSYTPYIVEFSECRAVVKNGSKYADLPAGIKNYIEYAETIIGIPIKIISYGPSAKQTMAK